MPTFLCAHYWLSAVRCVLGATSCRVVSTQASSIGLILARRLESFAGRSLVGRPRMLSAGIMAGVQHALQKTLKLKFCELRGASRGPASFEKASLPRAELRQSV